MKLEDVIGVWAEDKVSGFKGYITGVSKFLTGCNRVCISPKAKADGTHMESLWFDETQVQLFPDSTNYPPLESKSFRNVKGASAVGGPRDDDAPVN